MSSRADDFGGLADLFMSGGASTRGSAGAGARFGGADATTVGAAPRVLLVGNVPTLAGIWIAQYADQCARADGPVALIRIDGAATRGEIYRSEGRALPSEGGAWLERASAFARCWIVCLDSLTDAGVVLDAGGEIVLLSGTDETAMAGARRTIESLSVASAARGASLGIGLALVGCSADAAQSSVQSLVEWARSKSLAVRLTLAAHAQRVDRVESSGPVPLSVLGALDTPSAIEMVAMAMRGNPARRSERDVPRLRIDDARAAESGDGVAVRPAWPAATTVAAPTATSPPATAATPTIAAPTIAPPTAPPTAPTIAPPTAPPTAPTIAPTIAPPTAPPVSVRAEASVLAALFPELHALAFHCPDAPSVLLASDSNGLHLLACESNASDLRVAGAWARANWALLCAAVPAVAARGAITEHLLLNDPTHAVGLHRSGVLLHAAVDFDLGGRIVRRRIDLNTAQSAGLAR
jgi:hypothetical protein